MTFPVRNLVEIRSGPTVVPQFAELMWNRYWGYRWLWRFPGSPFGFARRGTASRGAVPAGHTSGMSEHTHNTETMHDEGFWNERYRSAPRVWSSNPNPQLVAEIANLEPGRALDVGCGEGADAIWLAQRGWDVVATDISSVALERGSQHARDSDPVASAHIEWRQANLLVRPPEPNSFDLVSAQFMHLPPEPRTRLFTALAAAVRTGGTLLIVGHHSSDLTTGVPRPPMPDLFYSADEVAGLLDDSWMVVVNEARPRQASTPEGVEVTIHDAVLLATRRTVAGSTS
jgi:SAM-dependent methyltransferase